MRMIGLKENYNGIRIRQACTAEGINFAELYSLRKDHKPIREGEEALGPKFRPVCGFFRFRAVFGTFSKFFRFRAIFGDFCQFVNLIGESAQRMCPQDIS